MVLSTNAQHQAVSVTSLSGFSVARSRGLLWLLFAGWLAIAAIALLQGPGLSEHEVIVAQTARQMIESGEWLVPHYLDTPFLVKPPLMPWLVAAVSLVLPHDAATDLAVTAFSARLPSALAALLMIWLVARLGCDMFHPRAGVLAAFVSAASLGTLLYAFNATVEMVLAFLCTWAFAEFWWALKARSTGSRRRHLFFFYLALGLAMMAKGPMPMVLVGLPLAAWWWLERPVRLLAAGGPRYLGSVAWLGLWQAWPRLRRAVTTLGVWWGIPLFLAMFVPWMVHVGRQQDYAWEYWKYEYLQRMEGDYPGSGQGNAFYYLPILFGLALPWALSVPEALASPFLRAFRPHRRPMTFLWFWVVVGVFFVSLMSFKKPYYVLPAIPGLALLLTPVLESFFFGGGVERPRLARWAVAGILLALVGMVVGLWWFGVAKYPEFLDDRCIRVAALLAFGGIFIGIALAGVWYVRRLRVRSLLAVGLTSAVVFTQGWSMAGPKLAHTEAPAAIVDGLARAGVPPNEVLHWAGLRPDGRVLFYGRRPIGQVVDPYRLIAEHGDRVDRGGLRMMVATEVCGLLESPVPAYIVLKRDSFEQLMRFFKPPAREMFSVDRGDPGKDDGDWVVVTNVGAPGSAAAMAVDVAASCPTT